MKGKTGIARLIAATGYSWQGLRATFRGEAAFRQELAAAIVLVPLALWLDVSRAERALLLASVLLVLIVELLNSALEALVDRISDEQHPLAGRAKDMGSAAVMLSLVTVAVVWAVILIG